MSTITDFPPEIIAGIVDAFINLKSNAGVYQTTKNDIYSLRNTCRLFYDLVEELLVKLVPCRVTITVDDYLGDPRIICGSHAVIGWLISDRRVLYQNVTQINHVTLSQLIGEFLPAISMVYKDNDQIVGLHPDINWIQRYRCCYCKKLHKHNQSFYRVIADYSSIKESITVNYTHCCGRCAEVYDLFGDFMTYRNIDFVYEAARLKLASFGFMEKIRKEYPDVVGAEYTIKFTV